MGIVTMDSILRKVLSQANADQNQSYPPRIYEEHFNIVSKFLIGDVAKSYPGNDAIVKLGMPFTKVKDIPVINGTFELPKDHWKTLGITIFVSDDFSEACDYKEELTDQNVLDQKLKKRSKPQPVDEVDQYEFKRLINHSYKAPTLEKPIAALFGTSANEAKPVYNIGPNSGIPMVQLSYLVEPKEYVYGYTMNPDDTYQYDASKGVESEWNENATEYLFKGVNILYSAYVRDNEQREWAQILKQTGLY
jgi:hypothetical protein